MLKRHAPQDFSMELSDFLLDCIADEDCTATTQKRREVVYSQRRNPARNLYEAAALLCDPPLTIAAATVSVDVRIDSRVQFCQFVISILPDSRYELLAQISVLTTWDNRMQLRKRGERADSEHLRAALFCIVHGSTLPPLDEERRRVEKQLLAENPFYIPDVRKLIDRRDDDWWSYQFILPDQAPCIDVQMYA